MKCTNNWQRQTLTPYLLAAESPLQEKPSAAVSGGSGAGAPDYDKRNQLLLTRVKRKSAADKRGFGGTVDDTELVHGLVFDKGAKKTAGGPTRVTNAKIGLIQFCLSAPKVMKLKAKKWSEVAMTH